jgi:hypothetical protein
MEQLFSIKGKIAFQTIKKKAISSKPFVKFVRLYIKCSNETHTIFMLNLSAEFF